MIYFEFDGKQYRVGDAAYDCNRILLLDGRVLRVFGWFETLSYVPQELEEVTGTDLEALERDRHMRIIGVPATELPPQ